MDSLKPHDKVSVVMGQRKNNLDFLSSVFGLPPEPTPTPQSGLEALYGVHTPKPLSALEAIFGAHKNLASPLPEFIPGLLPEPPKPSGIDFSRFGAESVHFCVPTRFPWSISPPSGPALYAILVKNVFSPGGFRVLYFGQTGDTATRPTKSHEHYDDWCRLANGASNLYVAYHWMFGSTEAQRVDLEKALIAYHSPECNTVFKTNNWLLEALSKPAPKGNLSDMVSSDALLQALNKMLSGK